jgi:hypothetical protein
MNPAACCGGPKSAFTRVHRRRMPWARRGSPGPLFPRKAAVGAQGRLSQLSARSGLTQRDSVPRSTNEGHVVILDRLPVYWPGVWADRGRAKR